MLLGDFDENFSTFLANINYLYYVFTISTFRFNPPYTLA